MAGHAHRAPRAGVTCSPNTLIPLPRAKGMIEIHLFGARS